MNQGILSSTLLKLLCSPLIQLHIILFSLLTKVTLSSVDPKFEACVPVTCGNGQTISFPFYILGKQEPFCGNPGFEVSCGKNGFPIVDLINTKYVIQDIFYNNQSIRVSNPVFSGQTTSECIAPAQNLTVGKYNFYVAPKQRDLFLFYECDLTSIPQGIVQEHRIGCSEENKTSSVLGFYAGDSYSSWARGKCKGGVVNAAVEDGEGRIQDALRKGFVLNWNAGNCSTCSSSGGRCGFDLDPDTYTFRCFCADGVHAVECDLPTGPKQSG